MGLLGVLLFLRECSRVESVEAHLLLGVVLLRSGFLLGGCAVAVLLRYRVDVVAVVFLSALLGRGVLLLGRLA